MLSRGHRDFPFVFFGLPVLKLFVGNTFNLTENFGYRNFLCMRTENHVLQSKFFVSEYEKKSWEPLLKFRMFGISKTILHITVFLQFFCLTVPKNFLRNHLMFQKFSNVRYRKSLCIRTENQEFQSKFFVSKNFRLGTLRYMRKVRLSKKFMPKRMISFFSVEFFRVYCL